MVRVRVRVSRYDLGVLERPQLGQHEGEDRDGRDEEDAEGAEVDDVEYVLVGHKVRDGTHDAAEAHEGVERCEDRLGLGVLALDVARLGGEVEREQQRYPSEGVGEDVEGCAACVAAVARDRGVVREGLLRVRVRVRVSGQWSVGRRRVVLRVR